MEVEVLGYCVEPGQEAHRSFTEVLLYCTTVWCYGAVVIYYCDTVLWTVWRQARRYNSHSLCYFGTAVVVWFCGTILLLYCGTILL